ncbi:CU044_5270 family protein [Phytohabitans houttuyneae]|uniref:Uncharacterized protein n=1 Tax=Phytohabitans houttuyneae TaxID=1076126 RepID=A0A6V8KKZ4_9ACTN|nr:CU044_5270 family protein [Phytohabitans houttuyneae]GFJ82839.1 hypothetical protein Phou_070190 [Phytohabitans houttuyneae]
MSDKKLMELLADARPRRLDPDPRRRPDPAVLMAHPRPVRGRRPARRFAVAGLATAAAVAAALTAVVLSDVDTDRRVAPVVEADAAAPSAPVPPKTARELLLVAAERTTTSTVDGDGRYWVLRRELGSRMEVGPAARRYHIMLRISEEMWLARRPGDPSVAVQRFLGAEPLDEAAWRADGSPTRWVVPGLDGGGKPAAVYTTAPGPRTVRPMRGHTADNNFLLAGGPVTAKQLAALPTEPASLEAWLVRRLRQAGSPEGRAYALFWSGEALVTDLPVPAAVRAAAYRMMAGLDGVRLLGEVTDARGRAGMAVAYTREGDGGRSETRLVIDPATGRASAEEERNAAGELTRYTIVDSAGHSDEAPPQA